MQPEVIADLSLGIPPIDPGVRVEKVAELFLQSEYSSVLSIPIVSDNIPRGIVSRYRFMEIYLKPFGRDLYGRQPIAAIMHTDPLIVDASSMIDAASRYISENMEFPIKDDFIVVKDGRYYGMGAILNLLKALEIQVSTRTKLLQKAYKQLKSSQLQLVQSEKMASLGQMVAGVAHEINTPLGYVRNNVEVSRDIIQETEQLFERVHDLFSYMNSEDLEEDELDRRFSEIISEIDEFKEADLFNEVKSLTNDSIYGLEQISEIVVNLKNFSRLDQAKVSDISINECIDSALVIGKNAIKYKAEVIKEYDEELPKVKCSPSQLNQVFLNLLTNAAQAIEEQGVITVKTWFKEGYVFASVKDTGKGITKEKMGQIFDPFFTTKKIGEGTGLGLSISYQIIKQHSGGIKVKSKAGRGSEFIIRIPAEVETENQLQQSPQTNEQQAQQAEELQSQTGQYEPAEQGVLENKQPVAQEEPHQIEEKPEKTQKIPIMTQAALPEAVDF